MMQTTIIFLFRICLSVFINLLQIQFRPFATKNGIEIHDIYSASVPLHLIHCGVGEGRLR